jgi:hypothetical protein
MLWDARFKHTLSGPFQREWENISSEFANNPDFFRYFST